MSKSPNIVEYAAYNLSMRIQDGYYIFTLHYPQKWKGIAPEDGGAIHVVNDDSDPTVFYYMTEVSNGVDEIFELVDETISYNRELELKASLIKEKVKELEELFISESYDRLLNLRFVIDDPEQEVMDALHEEVEQEFVKLEHERLEASKTEETTTETTVTETSVSQPEAQTTDQQPQSSEELPKSEESTTQKQEIPTQKNIAEAKIVDSKIAEAIRNKTRRRK